MSRGSKRADAGIALLVLVLAAATAAVWFDPEIPTRAVNPLLDVTINVAASLVGGTVAVLAWVRWRETRRPASLFQASAFLALSTTNVLLVAIVITGQAQSFGMDPSGPTAAPVYLWSAARLSAALLLLVAARVPRSPRLVAPAWLIALGPAAALLAFGAGLAGSPVGQSPPDPTIEATLQLVAFTAFSLGALGFRTLYLREGRPGDAVLVVGLILAGFSQLHFAFDPVLAAGVVTSGDILRVFFNAVLLYSIQAEIQGELREMRRANAELERLREIEAASAVFAERSRLAREIHDGLAQDLWSAKLKQGRVIAADGVDEEVRASAQEVMTAIDAALGDARQAVMALRTPVPGADLEEMLRGYLDEFGDRYGIRTDFEADGSLPAVGPRTEAEVLRIVQEALNNVRKHADATMVRVRAATIDDSVVVSVADNGRGFDVKEKAAQGFGLRGMHERADLIGAQLEVESAHGDGARVTVRLAPHGALRQ
jgi:signal transduction histidine kinase